MLIEPRELIVLCTSSNSCRYFIYSISCLERHVRIAKYGLVGLFNFLFNSVIFLLHLFIVLLLGIYTLTMLYFQDVAFCHYEMSFLFSTNTPCLEAYFTDIKVATKLF